MASDDPQPMPPKRRSGATAELSHFVHAVQHWLGTLAASLRSIPPAALLERGRHETALDRAAIRVVEICQRLAGRDDARGEEDLRSLQQTVDELTTRSRDLLALEKQAAQQRVFSGAVCSIYASNSFSRILQEASRAACGIFNADCSAVTLVESDCCTQPLTVLLPADGSSGLHQSSAPFPPHPDAGLEAHVCRSNLPLRLTPGEFESHPARQRVRDETGAPQVARCYLAAPLVAHDGQNLGLIQLLGSRSGEFSAEDETLLVQLASVTAAAVENVALQQQLRNADRRKNEMLTMLAHELRNPLAPIRNGLDLLAMTGVAAAAPDVLDGMRHQVEYLTRFADDLLDVARIVRGRVELRRGVVEVAEIVERAVETVRPLIDQHGHQLRIEMPQQPLTVNADRVRIAQAIGNLLTNAAKYTPPGGLISLAAHAEDGPDVVITVRDTGVGIAGDLLPHVFDLFRQADDSSNRSQGGLGIGLSLVKRFVQLHGGSVSVQSDGPGRGAEFAIRLPLYHASQHDAPDPPVAPPPADVTPADASYRILVVDDSRSATTMLSRLLTKLGKHDVSVAHDGREALEVARAERPDVILLDVGLPELSGHEVGRELRQDPELRDALLVAVTGHGDDEAVRRSTRLGFDLHLVKPCGIEELASVLRHPRLVRR